MVVSQFIDTYYPVIDGVVQTVANYQRELRRREHRCLVIAPDAPGYDDPPGSDIMRYRSYSLPMRPPYRVGLPQVDIRFRSMLEKRPIDLVHVHSPFACGDLGLIIARQRDIPIVGTFHSKYYDDFYQVTHSEMLSKTAVQSVARFYRRLDEVWCVSEATAYSLREYGYRGPITVMPNGTDLPLPPNAEALADRARATFHMPADAPCLLFVGQHVWQKNIRLLLETAQALKQQGKRFALYMAGEGVDQADIDALIEQLQLDDTVTRLGVVRDRELLTGLYLNAKLLAFPSLYDNAPLVVREAASLHIPSLLVAGATCAQGVEHGRNGYLGDGTPEGMARVVCEALADEAKRAEIGCEAANTLAIPWAKILDHVVERYAYLVDAYAVGRKKGKSKLRPH